MTFKRSSVRYSTTPEPSTPYQAAQQLWDERIGSARVQARNWRLMAFGCLSLAVVMAAGLIWQSSQSHIAPYVVEVDHLGDVKAVGAATEAYRPTDALIAHHLERFMRDVRSVPLDPIVLRDDWLEAYDYTTERGATTLNEYARANDPFAHVGQTSIAIEVTSIVRASDTSFQVRWIERSFANGAPTTTERWTAILSIVIRPPADVQRLRKNPLGLYVDGLNWSRELGTAASERSEP
jgi:type IV secretory pathway TrbF-like protein